MTTELEQARFRRVMELVDQALDLPHDERDVLLARECEDPVLRTEVEKLLAADADASECLSETAAMKLPSLLSELAEAAGDDEAPMTSVGPFRLVSRLGRGGMGEVWVAERTDADFEQKVAVKLLSGGRGGPDAVARFGRERRILARLTHPNIARLLDGGVTPEGQPWLAMELVEGKTLVAHCREHSLDLAARLRLFAEVCDAVQFAHRNLVVHRDLKPANILVTEAGVPKLLDFGIAKLVEEETDGPALTRTGERPMTPEYAAPEQVRGDVVTTATDVWALGVILHELLTGVMPYATTGKSRSQVEKAILEGMPARPSTRVGEPVAGLSPSALRRALKGDLDAIVLKAMRLEPEQRYAAAEALAADLRRHLSGAPVLARGDATGYLIRTTLRRHRVVVGFSALVLVALVAGLVGTLWQAKRAREEAQKSERALEFLVGVLRAFDPVERGGKPVTQSEILERGEARVTQDLADQPEAQARLLAVFAETWFNIGDVARARPPAERAASLQRATLGARSLELARTLVLLGRIDSFRGELPASERELEEALAIARLKESSDGPTVLEAVESLGGVKKLQGKLAEAERLNREVLDVDRRKLGEEHYDTLVLMANLGLVLADEGKFDASVEVLQRARASFVKGFGAKHRDTLRTSYHLARSLLGLGKLQQAEALSLEIHTMQVEVLGADSVDVTDTEQLRGQVLDALGRPAESLALFEHALRKEREVFGARHTQIAANLGAKSVALRHLGRPADAEAAAREALDAQLLPYGEDHNTGRLRSALGSALLDEGHVEAARAELGRALALEEKFLGAGHPDAVATRAELARAK